MYDCLWLFTKGVRGTMVWGGSMVLGGPCGCTCCIGWGTIYEVDGVLRFLCVLMLESVGDGKC